MPVFVKIRWVEVKIFFRLYQGRRLINLSESYVVLSIMISID